LNVSTASQPVITILFPSPMWKNSTALVFALYTMSCRRSLQRIPRPHSCALVHLQLFGIFHLTSIPFHSQQPLRYFFHNRAGARTHTTTSLKHSAGYTQTARSFMTLSFFVSGFSLQHIDHQPNVKACVTEARSPTNLALSYTLTRRHSLWEQEPRSRSPLMICSPPHTLSIKSSYQRIAREHATRESNERFSTPTSPAPLLLSLPCLFANQLAPLPYPLISNNTVTSCLPAPFTRTHLTPPRLTP